MKALKKSVSITLDWDLLEKIKKLAEENDRPLSQYINVVMKEHVNQIETEQQK